MSDYRLYTVAVPEQAMTRGEVTRNRDVQSEGSVNSEPAATKPLSLRAGGREITVEYKGHNARLMADMLDELASNNEGTEIVPFFGVDGNTSDRTPEDGYYALENTRDEKIDPRYVEAPRFTGTLRQIGTRNEVWRSIETKNVQVENDFGNDTTSFLAVPSDAEKVKWYDGESATEAATVSSTVSAEYGNVDRYDANASSYTDPTLLYEVPYTAEGPVDCKVWDTLGNGSKTATVNGETVLDWQKVFSPGHEYEGEMVVSNGLLRIYFDEDNGSMSVEEWDDANSTWSSVSLTASDWVPQDVDIFYLGESRLTARIEFVNTSDGSLFILNMNFRRGFRDPQWYIPSALSSTGPTPSGLQDKLDSIAHPSIIDTGEDQSVVTRSSVRQ